jgi:hypothetical protein
LKEFKKRNVVIVMSQSKVKKEQQIYCSGRYEHGVILENFPEYYLAWLQLGLPYENTPAKRPTVLKKNKVFQSPPVYKQSTKE